MTAARIGIAILLSAIASLDAASAQTAGILANGNAVVTGFSGAPRPQQIAPGQDPGDLTFIDPNGPSARIFNLQSPDAPPQAQVIPAPSPFTATAAQIGQVFGVALDNATPPNIYVAASSAYGLPIVVPGPNGAPVRVHQGTPGATFMAALFGPPALGGGPGSIWRIDGRTGAVSLFANVTFNGAPNSGPALGGLAFDPGSSTLIVADRQTGMIESFNLSGQQVGSYDHGVQGLGAAGQAQVPYTPSQLDITNPQFSSDNSATWDYAPPQRLIFGLGVQGGRLYYAVAAGLQIWSVSIAADGSFGGDARLEVQVPPGQGPSEISKITFDASGDMILAERGEPTGDYELMAVAQPAIGRVLRYALLPGPPPTWQPVPDQYAIGFQGQFTNADGGVAVGYNYDVNGHLDPASCGGFLWSTGEQLRNSADPNIAAQLAATGPLDLNGLQGNALSLVMPANEPPLSTYFVDYAAQLDDPAAAGHLGDIAIPINCGRGAGIQFELPPWLPPWWWSPPIGPYCPPHQMNAFGQCCLPGQHVLGGRCMCPGNAPPGPNGQCSCSAGTSPQPGFQCCPAGTYGSGGACKPICPNYSTKAGELELCTLGINPVPNSSGQLTCLDGNVPNPPIPQIWLSNNPPQNCISQSPLGNAANCPAGWTLQSVAALGGAMLCQPPPSCAGPGQQIGLNGQCQELCPPNELGYPITQCCPNGVAPGPNGICAPPPSNCTPGGPHYCEPLKVCDILTGNCCPSGTTQLGNGVCVTTASSCPGNNPILCCPNNGVPNFNTYPPSCCPPGQVVQLNGSCGPPKTPPNCPAGDTVFCKPIATALGAGCAPSQQLGNGYCCPGGTKVQGSACVATGKACPAGVPQTCCSRDETPNYIRGGCCQPGTVPNSDGVCRPPCPPGESLVNGVCQCPAGETLQDGRCVQPPSCTGGQISNGVCQCPRTQVLVNGVCQCPAGEQLRDGVCVQPPPPPPPPQFPAAPPPPPTCYPPYVYNPATNMCVLTSTPPPGGATGLPVPTCTGGEVLLNGVCQCPAGEVLRDGRCATRSGGTPTPTCTGGEVLVNGVCQCPAGEELKDGRCAVASHAVGTPTPTCTGGEVLVNGVCQCPAGEALKDGRCAATSPSGGTQTPTCTGGEVLVGGRCQCPAGEALKDGRCAATSPSGGTQTPTCTGGEVLVSGRCQCPAGEELKDGRCAAASSGQPKINILTPPGNAGSPPEQKLPLAPKLPLLNGPSDERR